MFSVFLSVTILLNFDCAVKFQLEVASFMLYVNTIIEKCSFGLISRIPCGVCECLNQQKKMIKIF